MNTKKDFEATAKILKNALLMAETLPNKEAVVRHLVWDFADRFQKDNPAFDPVRFAEACGVRK